MGTRTPGVQAAIARLPHGARVLDAACGLGFDAAALHRRGFRVTATDASGPMVTRCRERLAQHPDIDVHLCTWAELPDRFDRRFDAVLCTGNALAHAPTTAARREALDGFAGVLVDGGVLVVDSHDWEALRARGDHAVDDPLVVAHDGTRCRRRLSWRVPPSPDDDIGLTLTLRLEADDRAPRTVEHHVTFHPFTAAELSADLGAAGFDRVEVVQVPGDERLALVAVRSGDRGPGPG